MTNLYLNPVFFIPVVLIIVASAVIGKMFGRRWALMFVLTTAGLVAIDVYAGFRARDAYLAKGAWTASSLAPLLYWMDSFWIVPGSFSVWLVALWTVRCHQRRRHRLLEHQTQTETQRQIR